MNDILLATIPAALVLVATLGARFVEHYLQSRRQTEEQKLQRAREIRDARRKYRESLVIPIREALPTVGSRVDWNQYRDIIGKIESEASVEMWSFYGIIRAMSRADEPSIDPGVLRKVATITNENIRELLERVLADASLLIAAGESPQPAQQRVLDQLGISRQKMRENVSLAYQKLEDYVALAD